MFIRDCMLKTGFIKNVAIIADFIISVIASSIKVAMPEISNTLFGVSAIILTIAVICVIIEIICYKIKK